MDVIRAKNKEIKKLNDKLKLLENGKLPVDCLRQQKVMRNQLKEMEALVRRLKDNSRQQNENDPVCLKLDFYERRIGDLTGMLAERDADLERCRRAYEQKVAIFKETNSVEGVDIEFRLNEIEVNYIVRLEKLENLVASLRSINREFEQRFNEKQVELDEARKTYELETSLLKARLEASVEQRSVISKFIHYKLWN